MISNNSGKANTVHALMSKWSSEWGVDSSGVTLEYMNWLSSNDVKKDSDGNVLVKPNLSEVNSEIERLQIEYDKNEYSRKRKAEYPSILECIHAILDNNLDSLQIKRSEIKKKYPKP
jgi:hypothetical protein